MSRSSHTEVLVRVIPRRRLRQDPPGHIIEQQRAAAPNAARRTTRPAPPRRTLAPIVARPRAHRRCPRRKLPTCATLSTAGPQPRRRRRPVGRGTVRAGGAAALTASLRRASMDACAAPFDVLLMMSYLHASASYWQYVHARARAPVRAPHARRCAFVAGGRRRAVVVDEARLAAGKKAELRKALLVCALLAVYPRAELRLGLRRRPAARAPRHVHTKAVGSLAGLACSRHGVNGRPSAVASAAREGRRTRAIHRPMVSRAHAGKADGVPRSVSVQMWDERAGLQCGPWQA